MKFSELADTSLAVGATTKRLVKADLLATALRGLREDPEEIAPGAAYLAGELRQRQIGVGWAALRELPDPAAEPSLSVGDVDRLLAEIGSQSGPGSQARRRDLLVRLFGAASAPEQQMLRGLISGELRQGAQAGLLVDAIARAAEIPVAVVRRALLLSGDFKAVAVAALLGGVPALEEIGLQVGRPLTPMLAQSAASVADAIEATGLPAVVDAKLDGIRIQVHRNGDDISVFTRSLDEITARVPAVVEAVRALPVRDIVLDGEAMSLDDRGRPRPFQETSSRAAQRKSAEATQLLPYFFDLLHLDGLDLFDEPAHVRWARLAEVIPAEMLVDRRTVDDIEAAQAASDEALAAGHEGVVVKAVEAPYDVGRRGNAWVKVKPRHTLDLVVLGVEWGHGRRSGLLSNLHLGALDPETGGFVMLGKTFKGMTDEMLRWQTERLSALAVDGTDDWVVPVRPELVVEIAFDGVQTSPRYPGGVALRFARVLRYREDKRAADADTIDTVRKLMIR
ncbi:MAG TPA: ATP-dependent DNA ligase [Micromonosporaceae bacterium]